MEYLVASMEESVSTIFSSLNYVSPLSNARLNILADDLVSAFMMASLGTTVVTTFLIGYRIHKVAVMSGSRAKRRFGHIVGMIAESAAAYSLILIGPAIINLLPMSPSNLDWLLIRAQYYIQPLTNMVAGLATTVLVARVAIKNRDREQTATQSPGISELELGSIVEGGIVSPSPGENEPRNRSRDDMVVYEAIERMFESQHRPSRTIEGLPQRKMTVNNVKGLA